MSVPKITFSGKWEYERVKNLAKIMDNPLIYARIAWRGFVPTLEVVIEGYAKDEKHD